MQQTQKGWHGWMVGIGGLLTSCGTFGLDPESSVLADTGGLAAEEAESDSAGGDGSEPEDSGGSYDDDEAADSSGGRDGGSGSTESACNRVGFDILIHQATQDNSVYSQPLFTYQARDTDITPFSELQIFSYQGAPYHGPATAGRYSLADMNYADCALCVLLVTNCSESYSCDEVFFVSDGVLDVTDFGSSTGQFRAVLRDLVLTEVRIDPATYESTPVSGGDSWCVDEIDISVATYLYQ